MTSGFQIPQTGASLRVHSILVDEEAAASYSQSICPNLIFLIVDGAGPGCGLFKVLELVIVLSHYRVISGSGAAGVTTAVVLLAVELVSVVLAALVELASVVLALVELAADEFEAESLVVVEFAETVLLSVEELVLAAVVVLLSELKVVAFVDVVELLELDADSVESLEAAVVLVSAAVDVELSEVVLVSVEVELSVVDSSVNRLRSPPASAAVDVSAEVLSVVVALAVELADVDDVPSSNKVGKSTPVMINFLVESSYVVPVISPTGVT
jgi:hypothetical protein